MAHPFTRLRDGSVRARLSEIEASIIRQVAGNVSEVVDEPPESARRLFPIAYPDDADRQQNFAAMTRDELVRSKKAAAERVVASLEDARPARGATECLLDEETAQAWLRVLNDARLVLGTQLDVSEDMDHTPLAEHDPRAPSFNMYLYLGAIQEALLDELRPG